MKTKLLFILILAAANISYRAIADSTNLEQEIKTLEIANSNLTLKVQELQNKNTIPDDREIVLSTDTIEHWTYDETEVHTTKGTYICVRDLRIPIGAVITHPDKNYD